MRTVWLSEQQMSIDTVVFATDFSPASYVASLYATALAEHFHCKLLLMHVFVPSQSAQDAEAQSGLSSEDRKLRQQRLDLTAAALKPHNGEARSLLVDGDPSKMIPKVVNQMDHALLVLGTHGGHIRPYTPLMTRSKPGHPCNHNQVGSTECQTRKWTKPDLYVCRHST